MVETNQTLVEAARTGSGIATVYRALDELVDLYALEDAAVVVDAPGFGRQVLHAGRRPLHDDEHGLHAAEPGLYLQPPLDDPVLNALDARPRRARLPIRLATVVTTVSLDQLELSLRQLSGVIAVGFVESDELLVVEIQAGSGTYDELARDATVLAAEYAGGPVAVEIVRWGDGSPPRARSPPPGGGADDRSGRRRAHRTPGPG